MDTPRKFAGERMPAFPKFVVANWAVLMGLWALPYLSLLRHVGIEPSEPMQWLLLVICCVGSASIFYIASRDSLRLSVRASHGLRSPS